MPAGVNAMTALANFTVSSTVSSITFSSISQAYKDLILIVQPTANADNAFAYIYLNADTANYSTILMSGSGSTAASQSVADPRLHYNAKIMTSPGYLNIINFMDYSATDKHKTWLAKSTNAVNGVDASVTRWANTAAVTTIRYFYPTGDSITAGSTFALYGVSA